MKRNNRKVKFISVVNWVILFSLPIILLTVNVRPNTVISKSETKTLATSLITKIEDEAVAEEKEVEEKAPEEVKEVVKKEVHKKVTVEKVNTEEDYEAVRKQMAAEAPAPEPAPTINSKKYELGLKFNGNMSGYGPWQDLSGGWHLVTTSTRHNLLSQGVYTNDSTYGKVRIVAGDTEIDENRYYLLPTYSIIKCTLENGSSFLVKVMDRGDQYIGRGKKFQFDLAYERESQATTLYNVSFEILRMGP